MYVLTEFSINVLEQTDKTSFIIIGENKHTGTPPKALEIHIDGESNLSILELEKPPPPQYLRRISASAVGLLGIIRFTTCYYLLTVTKCSMVALLGGHKIYHIDETNLVPLTKSQYQFTYSSVESRLLNTFQSLDLTKTFYFSPTYDLTNTLQINTTSNREPEKMFVWNSFLLRSIPSNLKNEWFRTIIHGFIDQAKINVFGNDILITLIARRSHHFAGARFFKRGVNNDGYPANEVETEQIVSNGLCSKLNDRYTSYVQHRASICVFWSQMSNNMSLQPPITLDARDPFYTAAGKHFNRMLHRYSYPLRVFNLVKTKEKRPRESLLCKEFENCIRYLNQFLPQNRSEVSTNVNTRNLQDPALLKTKTRKQVTNEGGIIEYTHWDMSRASKGNSTDVMDYLGKYAKQTLEATNIFQAGKSTQQGICRTNCIDCLDRTNAAQSVIGKYALGYQLYALGIIDKRRLEYDTDVMDLLTEMYHDHGDTLALQYGGSNLVNTVETYRRINQWSSHSRDLVESLRRYYTNSFVDHQRQAAINVFLGNYEYTQNLKLWELDTDYYLHNQVDFNAPQPSYQKWWEPRNLLPPQAALPDSNWESCKSWPYSNVYTPLNSLFMYRINSTNKYSKSLSPFDLHWKRPKPQPKVVDETTTQLNEETAPPNQEDQLIATYTDYLAPQYVEPQYPEFNYEVSALPSDYIHKYKLEPEDLQIYTKYVDLA